MLLVSPNKEISIGDTVEANAQHNFTDLLHLIRSIDAVHRCHHKGKVAHWFTKTNTVQGIQMLGKRKSCNGFVQQI